MGVDLTILKAKGFLFPANHIPTSIEDNLHERSGLRPAKELPSDVGGTNLNKKQRIGKEDDSESENDEQSPDQEEEEGRSTGYRKEKGLLNFLHAI
jgi:hypothetical protein